MKIYLVVVFVALPCEICSEKLESNPYTYKPNKETLYARDRIVKRGSYKEAPPAINLVSLSELSELSVTESDELTEYIQNTEQAPETTTEAYEYVTDIEEVEDEERTDEEAHTYEQLIKSELNTYTTSILSDNEVVTKSPVTETNDPTQAVPSVEKTTEVPKPPVKHVTPIFTNGFDLQTDFPSRWTDFQIDIGSILPSREFNPVQTSVRTPYYGYGVAKHRAYKYSSSAYMPNYGFTRHKGPVYSKAVNVGRFGSLGGHFEKQNKERQREHTSYFPQSRNFDLDPVIRRMMRNINVYQTYPGKGFGRSRYEEEG